jgi:hypothetical protein
MEQKPEIEQLVELMREYQRKLRKGEGQRPGEQAASQRRIQEHRRGVEALIKAVRKRKLRLRPSGG